jgi:predicted permease
MLDILTLTTPIYLLIALGYGAVTLEIMSKEDVRALGRFVLYFAIPALLFRVMSRLTAADIANVDLLFAFAIGSFAILALAFCVARFVHGRSVQESVLLGAGASISNSGVIGYALVEQWMGPRALVAIALAIIVENIILAAAIAIAETGDRGGQSLTASLASSFVRLLKSPIIVGILAGALAAIVGFVPPPPVARVIDLLANALGPVALFTVGGTLVGIKVRGLIGDVSQIVLAKLALHPIAIFAALMMFPGIDPLLKAAAITTASAPIFNIFPIIGQKFGMEKTGAAAVLMATIFSFMTVAAVLGAIQASGWFGPIHPQRPASPASGQPATMSPRSQ